MFSLAKSVVGRAVKFLSGMICRPLCEPLIIRMYVYLESGQNRELFNFSSFNNRLSRVSFKRETFGIYVFNVLNSFGSFTSSPEIVVCTVSLLVLVCFRLFSI